jgi:hypothetical protein
MKVGDSIHGGACIVKRPSRASMGHLNRLIAEGSQPLTASLYQLCLGR